MVEPIGWSYLERVTSSLGPTVDLEPYLADIGAGLEIIALRRLGDADDARDAVQETLARLLSRVREGRVADRRELELVAYGIVRHVIVDMLRIRGRRVALDSVELVCPATALQGLVSAEERHELRAGLATLAAADRDLLTRCFVEGERIGRIAESLGEPAERVRKRKSRALARLADAIRSRIRPRADD
jgi:RNA polymerase sigma factor (sigma-70 family)